VSGLKLESISSQSLLPRKVKEIKKREVRKDISLKEIPIVDSLGGGD